MSDAIDAGLSGGDRRLRADDRRQRLAVDVLHDDEIRRLRFAPVKDRDDVRVREICRRLSLATKARDERRVTRELGDQDFQGDGAAEQQIAGDEDLRGAASRDLLAELVAAAEDLVRAFGHRSVSLGRQTPLAACSFSSITSTRAPRRARCGRPGRRLQHLFRHRSPGVGRRPPRRRPSGSGRHRPAPSRSASRRCRR